jgi:hypothetical protein
VEHGAAIAEPAPPRTASTCTPEVLPIGGAGFQLSPRRLSATAMAS